MFVLLFFCRSRDFLQQQHHAKQQKHSQAQKWKKEIYLDFVIASMLETTKANFRHNSGAGSVLMICQFFFSFMEMSTRVGLLFMCAIHTAATQHDYKLFVQINLKLYFIILAD